MRLIVLPTLDVIDKRWGGEILIGVVVDDIQLISVGKGQKVAAKHGAR